MGKLVTLESLILDLVKKCDGAKKRDGSGFSRADSQDGMRLGGIIRRKIPLNKKEIQRSYILLKKYFSQLTPDIDEKMRANIAKHIQNKSLIIERYDENRDAVNYAYLSYQGKYIYLEIEQFLENYKDFSRKIYSLQEISHGVRKTFVTFQGKKYVHVMGAKKYISRWKISYSSSIKRQVISILQEFNFIMDPSIFKMPLLKHDLYAKLPVYAFVEAAQRREVFGDWVVIDFYKKNEEFIEYVKTNLRFYSCRKEDDYNWYLLRDGQEDLIENILKTFKIPLLKV